MASTARGGRATRILSVLAITALATTGLSTAAIADPGDLPDATAHYDMSHSGTSLTDVSGNGRDGTLVNFGDEDFTAVGDRNVLAFRNNGYVSLPQGLVTAADNEFTVEMTVQSQTAANTMGWVIGDGVGNWNSAALGNHVFMAPVSAQGGYNGGILTAIRVYQNPGNGETRIPSGGASLNPGFSTVTVTSVGNTISVYVDGVIATSGTHPESLSDIIPSGDVLGYLGRSLYNGDSFLTADVTDVKFWDVALTPEQIVAAQPTAEEKAELTRELLAVTILARTLGSNPSAENVTSDLSFPASVNGVPLTWAVPDGQEAIAPNGAVTRPADGEADAVVTVVARDGSDNEYPLTYTVKAFTSDELAEQVQADLDAVISAIKTVTTENLSLVAEGPVHGSTISWASSDSARITETDAGYVAPAIGAADPYQGAGVISRNEYGDGDVTVTVTATVSKGGTTLSDSVTVTIKEKTRTAPNTGYAAATFESDGPTGERIWMASTEGNNFFSFVTRNGGQPAIISTVDTGGLRDPYIQKSADGDKYYMIATDLKVSEQGWGENQRHGSLKVQVWESVDLVNWERTNDDDSGIVVNDVYAGMTWAPESFWDESLQAYVVFFSSRMYTDPSRENAVIGHHGGAYNIVRYVITRDFKTFTSPPVDWQDTGYSRIDSTIFELGDYYYRITKNEESGGAGSYITTGKSGFIERSKVLTALTPYASPENDPETEWQLLDQNFLPFEGFETIRLNEDDVNQNDEGDAFLFLADQFSYQVFMSNERQVAATDWDNRLSQIDGWFTQKAPGPDVIGRVFSDGMPDRTRHGAFVNVPQTVLDAMESWTALAAVDSTTTVDDLDVTARTSAVIVTAEDDGTLAGNVVFTAGDWTETVKLAADGTASVTVPRTVEGTVSVDYDGYIDGLVNPSSTSFTIERGPDVEVTAEAPVREDNVVTIPSVEGVAYADADGATLTGEVAIPEGLTLVVTASAQEGYVLAAGVTSWTFDYEEPVDPTDPVDPVDRTELAAAIVAAAALEESDFTAESWAVFAAALTDARDAMDDQEATQEQIDEAREALIAAQDALVAATPVDPTDPTEDPTEPTDPSDPVDPSDDPSDPVDPSDPTTTPGDDDGLPTAGVANAALLALLAAGLIAAGALVYRRKGALS